MQWTSFAEDRNGPLQRSRIGSGDSLQQPGRAEKVPIREVQKMLSVALVLLFWISTSVVAETLEKKEELNADLQRDTRNLQSAEKAFQSGFAAEAEHYLSRIPPDSRLQLAPQKLELEVLLGFHQGDLSSARRGLRQLFKIGKRPAESPEIFSMYMAEELIQLRQFPSMSLFRSQAPDLKWTEFQKTLGSSQYPLFLCEIRQVDGSPGSPGGSPLDKHLQFSNALDFSRMRGRNLNEGDKLQLSILGALYSSYSVIRSRLDGRPESTQNLRENLRLCREKLSGFESRVTTADDRRWFQEYLYRLYFAGWALDGSASSSFEFADYMLRQEPENRKDLEALHLFRRTLDQLLLVEEFQFQSHDEDRKQQEGRMHQLAAVLRKMQLLYVRLEMESDGTTVAALADSMESYLFSGGSKQDFQSMKRQLLDTCGENRRNRESLILLHKLSEKKDKSNLRDAIIRRDLQQDSRELLSVMAYRYGSLAQAMP